MATANTNSLETNLNVDPYYDDFDESKNFHRMLFQPALAVQGRELTQMQTMIQNQIDRFGEHIFQEGSIVSGCEMNYDENISYVKLRDRDSANVNITLSNFLQQEITGSVTGCKAYVVNSIAGSEAVIPDTNTLYIRYTNSGTQSTFSNNEIVWVSGNTVTANVLTSATSTGQASHVSFGEGIIYAKDHFIRVPAQSIVIGKYTANTSYRIGFDIQESIVKFSDDSTLLDPARGAYNYNAPGSNRLKLLPVLVKKTLTSANTSGFVEILRIKNGQVEARSDKPIYAQINDYIARRTFDESGNYIVKGLSLKLREHLNNGVDNNGVYLLADGGDSTKLSVDVATGKAYVFGYEQDTTNTKHIAIDKGIDFEETEQLTIAANYGNYLSVNELVGKWDIDEHPVVSLRDTAQDAISGDTWSAGAVVGTEIGTARVRAVVYESGVKGSSSAIWKLYLYDIKMTSGTFANVRSAYYSLASGDGKADAILVSGNAVLQETTFNTGVYELPAGAVKTIRDVLDSVETQLNFTKSFDVTMATDGTFTVDTTVGGANELFTYSVGALNDTQKNEIKVTLNAAATSSVNLTGTITTQSNTQIIGAGTSFTTEINAGEVITIPSDGDHVVAAVVSDTELTLEVAASTSAGGSSVNKVFKEGQIINLAGFGTGADRTVTVGSTTSSVFDIGETLTTGTSVTVTVPLVKNNAQEKSKAILRDRVVQLNISDDTAARGAIAKTGPWGLGLADLYELNSVRLLQSNAAFSNTSQGTLITSDFVLDNGQRDNLYETGFLKLKTTSTRTIANGDVLLVSVDHFTQDTSTGTGYFSVDSYPIDDVNGTANTAAIQTQNIPVYTSPTTGDSYDLRNSIDIRPRITNTANSVTTITNISTNPANGSVILEGTGNGLRYLSPNENFVADLQFYLPRIDKIIMDRNGKVRAIRGVSSLNPLTPQDSSDGMTLGTALISPYPSLTTYDAKVLGRPELASRTQPQRIERHTMKDIGVLKQRINNLEYYTSLSLLETDAKNIAITDNAGLERFKNGILVDNFINHNTGDTTNLDYNVAVDASTGELRPPYVNNLVKLIHNSASSSGIITKPKDIILTINETTAVNPLTVGSTVTSSGSATGTLRHQVDVTGGSKLYLEDITGTFAVSQTVNGGSTITAIQNIAEGVYATLPYTHDLLIEQTNATRTRNLTGLAYTWYGDVTLSPDQDFWIDTVRLPDLNIVNTIDTGLETVRTSSSSSTTSGAAGIPAPAPIWGWRWDFTPGTWWIGSGSTRTWSILGWTNPVAGFGVNRSTQVTTSQQITNSERVTEDVDDQGDRLISSSILPFIRTQIVRFTGSSLKPSTRFYAFFDGEDVNAYCTPTDSAFANTANEGVALNTDASGNIYGEFRIPNDSNKRFSTGENEFKLTDSNVNAPEVGAFTSAADTTFQASGQQQEIQRTIVTTRQVRRIQTINTNTNTNTHTSLVRIPPPNPDPLAQTFRISDSSDSISTPGLFLTKLDLFFKDKDDTIPLYVEIRETDPSTSLVAEELVPLSRIKVETSDINISDDGSKPTPIYFPTPIYLLADRDYAIVMRPGGGNPNYTAFVARMGEDDLISGERVSGNPYTGLLFASANDRVWTPIQEEDLKFNAYFANFGTNSTGTVSMINENFENMIIDTISSDNFEGTRKVHGETTLTFSAPFSANTGEYISGDTSNANGIVTFSSGTSARVKDVTLAAKYLGTETCTLYYANGVTTGTTGTLTAQTYPVGTIDTYNPYTENRILKLKDVSGTFVTNRYVREQTNGTTGRISSIDEYPVDVANLFVGKLALQDTAVSFGAKLATSTVAKETSFIGYPDNIQKALTARRYVLTQSQEATLGADSCDVQLTLTNTDNFRHSPVIDIERAGMFCIQNVVNNISTNEANTAGGDSTARFITKTITLDEGQDAEDLKIYLAAYKPYTADIKVYYKILNSEDSDTIQDVSWVEMPQQTLSTIYSDVEDLNNFKEYEYGISTANLTGTGDEVQYTNSNGITFTGFKYFKIKIVLLSTSTVNPPRVRDFRTIALQK